MKKKKLYQVFRGKKLRTVKETLDFLGWTYIERKQKLENIMCCGEKVRCAGWLGIEHLKCERCGKGMQDVTGILPARNNCVGVLNFDEIEIPKNGRVWLAENVWL